MEFKVCRVCLERTASISVFNIQDEMQYCAKMMKCARVEVVKGDGLPDSICERCAADLGASYAFAVRCEAADRALRAAGGPAAPEPPSDSKQQAEIIKQEVKSENDPADGFEFETHFDDFSTFVDTDDVQISIKKKKKSKTKEKKTGKNGHKKVLPNHLRKRKLRVKTGPIQCQFCDRTLTCHSAFELHMRTHTKEKPFTCDICKKTFTSKHTMKIHILRHYGVKQDRERSKGWKRAKREALQCARCGRLAASRSAMEEHARTHTGEKPYACERCGNKYRLKGTLTRHMHCQHPDSHPGATYVCEHCGKLFRARNNIITHLRVHTGAKPYRCPFCPEAFRQISSMLRHKRLHTGEKPFSCAVCSRAFRDRSALRKHAAVHSAERRFACAACGKRLKSRESLRIHALRHSEGGNKRWVCSFCGLRVASKGNLKVHTERMHSERSGTCPVCHKSVPDVSAHARAHGGERPHACPQCARAFASARSLAHHVGFKHRNAGRFQCALAPCSLSFPTAAMLEFHVLKTHTRRAPHACPLCARAFLRASDLSRHRRLHHGAPRAPAGPPGLALPAYAAPAVPDS